ncbi:hypothetical protein HBH56_114170 [Parastagonospora nodorum]|uniref:Uncharacterized protein n=1 Tax=Phaeosphaeria nodorum (strain SN15 / ATCC MYA-4574 / FGSC 10173) TaxID=321614 RepID=A0A7U2I7H2_PHANO|nr:hypothetical protein HBH56_114170 [Parastagonospora nodorum]QRD04940.1 hypothetical protein JI435_108600 [Parastagonospora nodorum SN15]KAH3929017.1 hypothetical protein HBH54_134990 [Parastagonospora nodorum]KAH3965953.1 hypothetical protein HBH51_146490 [Parastagonospora nodorum]KAH4121844.1 hypothetical protein HBH47_092470 [Parastagonospora nodorum]
MPRHFRNTRRPAAFLHYPSQDTFSGRATRPRSTSPDMLRFAYGTRRRRPSPAPRRDEIEDLLSREMRAINEDMRRREERYVHFDRILNQDSVVWSRSSTPRGSPSRTPSPSRSLSPTPSEPREVYTLRGALTTHPFYTRHEIPLCPLTGAGLYPPLGRGAQATTIFHAVHPVPRRALRQLLPYQLRFVGEELDERLYEAVVMDEFAEHVSETMMRINELFERDGEDGVGCACRHHERIAARGDVTDRAARDDGVGSEETVVEEVGGDMQAVHLSSAT